VLPKVIIIECDYGATWPTWVPAVHEPPESGRTQYFPFDRVALSESLQDRLRGWQRWWETMTWPPDDDDHVVEEGEWRRFITEGGSLVEALQRELGSTVEVRLGFDST
jgi:hypothetical protein